MLTPFDLELFVAIANTGSLTTAARVCGVTRATITRRLAALEEHLAVTLVNRTTRDLSLDSDAFRANGQSADAAQCARVRRDLFHSIGSCSFDEPVGELKALGIL